MFATQQDNDDIFLHLLHNVLRVHEDHPIQLCMYSNNIHSIEDLCAYDPKTLKYPVIIDPTTNPPTRKDKTINGGHANRLIALCGIAYDILEPLGFVNPGKAPWLQLTRIDLLRYIGTHGPGHCPYSFPDTFTKPSGYISASANVVIDSINCKIDRSITDITPTLVGEPNPIEPIEHTTNSFAITQLPLHGNNNTSADVISLCHPNEEHHTTPCLVRCNTSNIITPGDPADGETTHGEDNEHINKTSFNTHQIRFDATSFTPVTTCPILDSTSIVSDSDNENLALAINSSASMFVGEKNTLSRQQDKEILDFLLLELLDVDVNHPIAISFKQYHINHVSDLIATNVSAFATFNFNSVHQSKCKHLRNYALMFVGDHGYIPPLLEWKKLTWESFHCSDTNLVLPSILQSFPWTSGYVPVTINSQTTSTECKLDSVSASNECKLDLFFADIVTDSDKDTLNHDINRHIRTLVGEPDPIESFETSFDFAIMQSPPHGHTNTSVGATPQCHIHGEHYHTPCQTPLFPSHIVTSDTEEDGEEHSCNKFSIDKNLDSAVAKCSTPVTTCSTLYEQDNGICDEDTNFSDTWECIYSDWLEDKSASHDLDVYDNEIIFETPTSPTENHNPSEDGEISTADYGESLWDHAWNTASYEWFNNPLEIDWYLYQDNKANVCNNDIDDDIDKTLSRQLFIVDLYLLIAHLM